nr:hypothetical protein [Pseudomonas sp. LB-090624]
MTLFERGAGIRTNLTPAGQALAESAPRIFSLVDQARSSSLAAAAGSLATLRVALSDGILPKRLAALLACSREEELNIKLQLFEVPLTEQLKGLQQNLFDVGVACAPGEPTVCPAKRCGSPNWSSPSHLAIRCWSTNVCPWPNWLRAHWFCSIQSCRADCINRFHHC